VAVWRRWCSVYLCASPCVVHLFGQRQGCLVYYVLLVSICLPATDVSLANRRILLATIRCSVINRFLLMFDLFLFVCVSIRQMVVAGILVATTVLGILTVAMFCLLFFICIQLCFFGEYGNLIQGDACCCCFLFVCLFVCSNGCFFGRFAGNDKSAIENCCLFLFLFVGSCDWCFF
jgi:hypothetical protein